MKLNSGMKLAVFGALSAAVLMFGPVKAEAEDVFSGEAWKGKAGTFVTNSSNAYFCPKGSKACYQVEVTGFGGSSSAFEMSFSDGEFQTGSGGKAKLTCEGGGTSDWARLPDASLSVLNAATKNGLIEVVGLPKDIRLSYAAKRQNGDVLFVTEDRNAKDYYGSFRFFSFHGGKLTEYKVNSVTRFRDGGSTLIRTDKGVFDSPFSFSGEKKKTFDGQDLLPVTSEEAKSMIPHIPGLGDKTKGLTPCNNLSVLGK